MRDKRQLTLKQKLFIEHYLETRNGVEAARRAGYKGSGNVLSVQAFENLRNPKISTEIERRLKPFILSANEVLNLLSLHAYGTVESLLDDFGQLDLEKAKENGSIRLIKKLRFHKETGMVESVELHDPQSAAVHLGKYHQLFPTQIRVTDETADKVIDEALQKHSLPKPETFGGESLAEKEM